MTAGPGIPGWWRDRPWIWFVILFLAVLAANLVMLWIANREPPIEVPH